MKWRNGKYERISEFGVSGEHYYQVFIYDFMSNGSFRVVTSGLFFNRPQAIAWAAKCRLARLHPGRLFDLTVSEGGDYDYV